MSLPVIEHLRGLLSGHRDHHPIPVMDGTLMPNNALDACDPVAAYEAAPDDIACTADGGVFVSCGHRVLFHDDLSAAQPREIVSFDGPVGALALHPDGRLLACVSGQGLAAVGPTGEVQWLAEVAGSALQNLTAVMAAPDGTVYLAEGARQCRPEDWQHDLLAGGKSGRLVRCSADLRDAKVLIDRLAWPHGLALTPAGDQLLFTESWAHTVSRCRLDGSQPVRVMRNSPGYPARINAAREGGHWVSFLAVRTQLVELVLKDRDFRDEMVRTIAPEHWITPALVSAGSYMEPLQGGAIRKLGLVKPWAPPRAYGLVCRIDEDGSVVESLHSRVGGSAHGITSARAHADGLLIVSKGHRRLLLQRRGGAQ